MASWVKHASQVSYDKPLVGDLLQLPPVKGRPIFSMPKFIDFAKLKKSPATDLWQKLKVVVIKTNYRQGEGNPWTELLNRVRVGQQTAEDIEVLYSRNIKPGEQNLLSKFSRQGLLFWIFACPAPVYFQ